MKILFEKDTEGCVQDSVSLSDWEFQGGKVSMELPSGLKKMEQDRMELFYSFEKYPELVLEDEEGAQVTLQFLDKKLKKEDTYEVIQRISEMMKDAFPQYAHSPVYLFSKGKVPLGWFLIKMEDRQTEHAKIVFSIEEHMALLTVSYPVKKLAKWRVLLQIILSSVKIHK